MKASERLPAGLGAALGGVALAALLLGAALAGQERAGAVLAAGQAGLSQLRRERAELEALEGRRPAYAAFLARGLVGEERRLRWVDALREAATTLDIPRLAYRLEVSGPLAAAGAGSGARETRMLLELELRHEAQLLDLFEALETAAGGLHSVADCSISRTAATAAATTRPVAPALGARCTLLWWTIPPVAKRVDPPGAGGA